MADAQLSAGAVAPVQFDSAHIRKRAKARRHYLKYGKDRVIARNCRNLAKRMADPIKAEQIREYRRQRKRKERQALIAAGLSSHRYGGTLRKKKVVSPKERELLKVAILAERNARQAWKYWLSVLAPEQWLRAYYADETAKYVLRRGLSKTEQYRFRYSVAPQFVRAERLRQSERRFLNPDYAAMWETDGKRWWRAARSNDGTITREFLRLLSMETHCAYCLEEITGSMHWDHVWPVSRGGMHSADNIVVCCARCNRRKHTQSPLQWLVKDFGSLCEESRRG